MSREAMNDNKYPEGAIVTARENPRRKLVILKYNQRIYYCAPAEDQTGKQSVYFERELIGTSDIS